MSWWWAYGGSSLVSTSLMATDGLHAVGSHMIKFLEQYGSTTCLPIPDELPFMSNHGGLSTWLVLFHVRSWPQWSNGGPVPWSMLIDLNYLGIMVGAIWSMSDWDLTVNTTIHRRQPRYALILRKFWTWNCMMTCWNVSENCKKPGFAF